MAELTFGPLLNKEQVAYATEVAEMARKIGVPPVLALGIAFKESSLDPNVKDSTAGAIGGMQVMPVHAKTFNLTIEQLRDPKINLEIGLKLLKENLDRTKDKDHPNGNWPMSAALYNAGDKLLTNANIAKNGFPAETEDYIKKLKEYGVFKTADSAPAEDYAGEAPADASAEAPAEAEDKYGEFERKLVKRLEDTKPDRDIIREATERNQAQLVGAGTGAAITAKRLAPAAIKSFGQMVEEGKIAAQAREAERVAKAAMGAGGAGITPPVQGGLSVLDPNSNQATRILQGTTGDEGTTGRARTGFNEETARQAAQRKGADNIVSRLKQAGVIASDAPEVLATTSGMTSSPSGVQYPRSEARPTLGPRGPEGQVGYTRPSPPPPPPPLSLGARTMTRATAGLDYVTDLFAGMMDSNVGRGLGNFMRIAGPPAAIAGVLGEGMNINQQMNKPSEERSYGDMALSGLGVAAGLASLAPAATVAIPAGLTAAGIAGYRYLRDQAEADAARQRMTGKPAKPVQARGFRAP